MASKHDKSSHIAADWLLLHLSGGQNYKSLTKIKFCRFRHLALRTAIFVEKANKGQRKL